MKKITLILLLLVIPHFSMADDSITVPLDEFKTLYKEHIEKQVQKKLQKQLQTDKKTEPFVYTIAEGAYALTLSSTHCYGSVTLIGTIISGKPEPFTLFGDELVIRNIDAVSGGVLMFTKDGGGIAFYPTGAKEFSIGLSVFVPVQEDNRSRFVTFSIPRAVKNALSLDATKDLTIVEAPGVSDKTGVYNFSSKRDLSIRYTRKNAATKTLAEKEQSLAKQFEALHTPPIVLDTVSLFTSFEENGNVLSVLQMDVPPEAGSFLTLQAVAESEIWNLKINGQKRKIYGNNEKGQAQWIIPLVQGKMSHVELATIQQTSKLGLRGKLETQLPGIGLPARKLHVALALPERVELMSVEGPVSPAAKMYTDPPREFVGKAYHFSRSFHKGEKIHIALSYKEPINPIASKVK